MKGKYSILLIDDDEPTNFLNQILLNESGVVGEVIVKDTAFEAIEYLATQQKAENPLPHIVIMDLNLPRMNGWEFLQEFEERFGEQPETNIVVLTTSFNPSDKERANNSSNISAFYQKPLTKSHLLDIIELRSN